MIPTSNLTISPTAVPTTSPTASPTITCPTTYEFQTPEDDCDSRINQDIGAILGIVCTSTTSNAVCIKDLMWFILPKSWFRC